MNALQAATILTPTANELWSPVIWIPAGGFFLFLLAAHRQATRMSHAHEAVTSGHRALVACSAAGTYFVLGFGTHAHHLLTLADPEAASRVTGIGAALLFGTLLCVLITCWKLVDDSGQALQQLARREEFAEHQGRELDWATRLAILTLCCVASVAWWLSLGLLLDLVGVLPAWIANLEILPMTETLRSLPAPSLVASGCFLAVFLALRTLSLGSFALRLRRRHCLQLSPCSVDNDLERLLDRATAIRRIQVRFATTVSQPSGASSCLDSWWRPSYLILLGHDLLSPEESDQKQAIIAHELAHCILRHHT